MLLVLAVVCAVAAGCFEGREHEQIASSGPWTRWEVTPSDEFGGAFTLIYFNAIVQPTESQPWTAVGYLVGVDGDRHPKAWTSRDGVAWTDEDLPPSSSSVRWDRPFKALRVGDAVVAFGLRGDGGKEGIVGWYRDPAGTWTTLSSVDELRGWGFFSIEDLAAGADGPIAVATRHSEVTSNIHVLRSSDGRTWTVEAGRLLGADTGRRIDAFGLAARGRREVIVGRSWGAMPPWEYDGEIWNWSPDWDAENVGRVQPRPPNLDGSGEAAVQGVVAFESGWVAVGLSSERPIAWVSEHGEKWTEHKIEPVEGGAWKVAVAGGRLVAIGTALPGPRLALWTSGDGRRWERVRLPESMTRLTPLERVDLVGGPSGELGIVASNDVESDIYLGHP